MGEFAGVSPFGSGIPLRNADDFVAPLIAPVAQSQAGSDLSGRMDSDSSGTGFGHNGARQPSDPDRSQTPDALVAPMPKADVNAIPGPPPAFQVSILELDAQLQETLARLNASQVFGGAFSLLEDANAQPANQAEDQTIGAKQSEDGADAKDEAAQPKQSEQPELPQPDKAAAFAAEQIADKGATPAAAMMGAPDTPEIPGETT